MSVEGIILQAVSGLSMGMVLFIIAAGLSIVFGALKVLNMAHGTFYMLGAYCCFWLSSTFAHTPGIFWLTVIAAPIMVALFGGLVERLVLRQMYGREMIYQLILTFGLILVIGDICKLIWGIEYHTVATPWPLTGTVPILGMSFPTYNIFLICIGFIVFAGLWAMFRKTRLGRVIRAVTYNRDMVSALGENVPLIYTLVFMLGCWLGGLGGTMLAPISTMCPGMDMMVIIECFIIVVIGGLGSLPGALVGAVIFGLVNSFGILVVPELAIAFPFILMVIILILRPWGLMGKRE